MSRCFYCVIVQTNLQANRPEGGQKQAESKNRKKEGTFLPAEGFDAKRRNQEEIMSVEMRKPADENPFKTVSIRISGHGISGTNVSRCDGFIYKM